MGLSLNSIKKKVEDVLGGVARQVNPFDGGATYSNPKPAPKPVSKPQAQSVWQPNTAGVQRVTSGPQAPVRINKPRVVTNVVSGDQNQGNDYRSIVSKMWDQANPLDNGRTFKQSRVAARRSVPQQLEDKFVKPVVDQAKGTFQQVHDAPAGTIVRKVVAEVTGNEQASQNANIKGAFKTALTVPDQYIMQGDRRVPNPEYSAYVQNIAMSAKGGTGGMKNVGKPKVTAKAPKPVSEPLPQNVSFSKSGTGWNVHGPVGANPYGEEVIGNIGGVRKKTDGTWTHSEAVIEHQPDGTVKVTRDQGGHANRAAAVKAMLEVKARKAPAPEAPKVPTHNAYGRKIEMTKENGYHPLPTADGGAVYQKVARTGSNAKGVQLTNTYYATDGTKLTQAQADAMVQGKLRSSKPAVTVKPVHAVAAPEPVVTPQMLTAQSKPTVAVRKKQKRVAPLPPEVASNVDLAKTAVEEVGERGKIVEQRRGKFNEEGGLRDQFAEHMIDTDAVAINTLKHIEKETGRKGLAETFIYNTNRLRNAPKAVMARFKNDQYIKAAVSGLSKEDYKAFTEYAVARAELKNYKKGMKTSGGRDANRAIVKARPEFEARYNALRDFYKNVIVPEALKNGRISAATARSYNRKKNYIHISRDMGDLQTVKGQGKGLGLNTTAMSNKRKGSTRQAYDPVASALDYMRKMEIENWRNTTATHLVKTLAEHGQARRVSQKHATHENVITIRNKGKVEYYMVSPKIKEMSQQLNPYQLGTLGKVVAAPARLLRGGATALNPVFAASNVVKDQVSSFVLSKNAARTHNPMNVGKGVYESSKAFVGAKNDPLWQAFEEVGGDMTQFDLVRNLKQTNEIIDNIRGGRKAQTKNAILHPVRTLEDMNSITEKATRFQNFKGMYDKAIADGKPHQRAIQEAQTAALENSINFGRAGDVGRMINLLIPYTNAAIQGGRQTVKTVRDRPGATIGKATAAIGVPVAAVTLWNTSDPQRREVYENMEEYEKENNLVIIVPNTKRDDVEAGSYSAVKIPLPPDLGNLFQGVRRGIEDIKGVKRQENMGEGNTIHAVATDLTKPFVGPVNTKSVSAFTGSVMPQAIKVIAQQYANRDFFTGNQIVSDDIADAHTDPTERYTKGTTETAKKLAKVGKKFGKNIEPTRIDKAVRDTFGTVGSMAMRTADEAQKSKTGIVTGLPSVVAEGYGQRFSKVRAKEDPNNKGAMYYAKVDKHYEKADKATRDDYDALHRTKVDGNKPDKTFYDAATRANMFKRNPKLLDLERKINKDVKTDDPFWKLPNPQQDVIVTLDTLGSDPGSNTADKIRKDNPWLQEYYDARSGFFDKLAAEQLAESKKPGGKPLPAASKLPQPPKLEGATKTALETYSNMAKGAEKTQFLKDNPSVADYFTATDEYQRTKRDMMGLPQFDRYPKASADLQRKLDVYNNLPKHDGKKGGNASRWAYAQANPDIGEFFSKIANYSLVKDAQLAVFEGEEMPSGSGSGSGSSSGSSSSGSSKGYYDDNGNWKWYNDYSKGGGAAEGVDVMAHTVSSHGKITAGHNIRAKKAAKGKAKVSYKVAKPKVTIKKSR